MRRLFKPNFSDRERALARLQEPKADPAPPAKWSRRLRIEQRKIGGFHCYSVTSRSGTPAGAVFYLHGGAYIGEITPEHWRFIGRLVEGVGCRVEVPIYGLAPEHTCGEAFPFLLSAYRELAATVDPSSITLAGDSCGGGLGLALAQLLSPAGLPPPRRMIFLSPWLDLTLSDPTVPEVDATDPWLSRTGLVIDGLAWAGSNPADPRLRPLEGPMKGLAPISLYVGTHDLCLPDTRRLRDLARAAGVPVTCEEAAGAFHVYPLIGVPEGRRAVAEIIATLRSSV